mgnify:CR=1 FL=1
MPCWTGDRGVPISVGYQSGSHYSTIQALEQYMPADKINLTFADGMLFHRLQGGAPGVDVEQVICELHEPVHAARFEQAWREVGVEDEDVRAVRAVEPGFAAQRPRKLQRVAFAAASRCARASRAGVVWVSRRTWRQRCDSSA